MELLRMSFSLPANIKTILIEPHSEKSLKQQMIATILEICLLTKTAENKFIANFVSFQATVRTSVDTK